jgi:hypothetical protein
MMCCVCRHRYKKGQDEDDTDCELDGCPYEEDGGGEEEEDADAGNGLLLEDKQ